VGMLGVSAVCVAVCRFVYLLCVSICRFVYLIAVFICCLCICLPGCVGTSVWASNSSSEMFPQYFTYSVKFGLRSSTWQLSNWCQKETFLQPVMNDGFFRASWPLPSLPLVSVSGQENARRTIVRD
jgi:hypothetical protein